MADDDIQDMAHVLGEEHFPSCPCFQLAGLGPRHRMEMYVMAQEYANGLVSNMITAGVCREAMPYYIALFVNMSLSMIASHSVGGENITPEGSLEFSRMQHEMLDKLRERTEALMRRADRLTFGLGQGTDSVQ